MASAPPTPDVVSLPLPTDEVPVRPTPQQRIRAALWFAERGFGIVPLWSTDDDGTCRCPMGRTCDSHPGKHPMALVVRNGVKDATTDPVLIQKWLSMPSEPNYGTTPPEDVIALDIDGTGLAKFAELEATLGPLPPTMRTLTPNGEHVFLRVDGRDPGGDLFGFVTRRHGRGYVVGPRSWHPSGAAYDWNEVQDIAPMPETWIDVLSLPEGGPETIVVASGGYEMPARVGAHESRYLAILAYVASRYKRGLSKEEIWAGVRDVLAARFEAGLAEHEVRERFERAWKGTPERLGEPMAGEREARDPPPAATLPWPEPAADPAYHGVLGDIVRAVAPHTEADPIGIMATLLVMFGTACGDARWFYQGSMQAPKLYVVLVGSTASGGRKGTSQSVANDVFKLVHPLDGLYLTGVASGEAIAAHFTRHTRKEPGAAGFEPVEPRALILEPEFGRALTIMSREGSTLSSALRNAWDGVRLGYAKAREEAQVSRHHVSLLGHITPLELRLRLTDSDASNGFANRILWIAVHRTRLVPRPESPARLVLPYVERLRDAIEAAQQPFEMRFDAAAADRWDSFYVELAVTTRLGLAGAISARHEAQVARLSLMYALADGASAIGVPHLEAAIAFADYARRSAVWAFGDSTGNRHADVLRRMLSEGPMGWDEAKRTLGLRTAADMALVVDILVEAGLAEVVKEAKPGGGRAKRELRAKGAKGASDAGSARTDEEEAAA